MDRRKAVGRGPGVRAALAVLALVAGVAACDVDPNAPGRRGGGIGGGGPRNVDLSGEWVYNVSNLAGAGVACDVSGVVLSLRQQDSTFTGSYDEGQFICVAGEQQIGPEPLRSGTVLNGVVRGDSVFFDLDTPDWRSRGRLVGNSMSGHTTVRIDLGLGQVYTLVGTFGAARR